MLLLDMEWFKGNFYLQMTNSCDSIFFFRYINKLYYRYYYSDQVDILNNLYAGWKNSCEVDSTRGHSVP